MLYRRFGRTNLSMPVLSCGGMRYQESWDASADVTATTQRNLEATVDRALELGITHFETARGYGTSEAQLGRALERVDRERCILQTKVPPREDPGEFARFLEESFTRLRVDYLDLFAIHGINNHRFLRWTLRPGGCWEVAKRLQDAGRIGHMGFSTHGPTRLIVEAIESGRFEYVNLHWYYIFQDNLRALEAAGSRDMGVFIISPSDKGGRLYDPPERLRELCRPLSPMAFNDAFCLAQPSIHTLSVGAARPGDFDEHIRALELLRAGDGRRAPAEELGPIVERLESAYRAAVGEEFAARWREGIPEWQEIPGGVNVRAILWLRNLAVAFDLLEYAKMRYNLLGKNDHWFPGFKADRIDDRLLVRRLRSSPFAENIPGLLREAHAMFDEGGEE